MEWILLALAVMIIAVLTISYWTYTVAFYSPKKRNYNIFDIPKGGQYDEHFDKMIALIKDMDAASYEKVTIQASDGATLFARYHHVADGGPIEIQFHGYRGTGIRDFCSDPTLAWKLGRNTLVVDQRGIGQSDGTTVTFGLKERYDVLDWIEYARKRFGEDAHIYLSGVSMGATTVLMASGLNLPDNVKGIVADCPFSSPVDIVQMTAKDMGYPPKLAMPFIKLGARIFGKFNLSETTAAKEVTKAQVPIIIIHGEDDLCVPCQMSEEIYHANPDKIRREVFKGAGHGLSYMVNEEEYERIIVEFYNDCERQRNAEK